MLDAVGSQLCGVVLLLVCREGPRAVKSRIALEAKEAHTFACTIYGNIHVCISFMLVAICHVCVGLGADRTLVRTVARVQPKVYSQVKLFGKGLGADTADIGSLDAFVCGVSCCHVRLERALLRKSLITLFASEWSLSRVTAHVSHQVAVGLESRTTAGHGTHLASFVNLAEMLTKFEL